MNTKKFTGAGVAIGAATAVTALLIGSTSAYASENGTESAFGVSASGLVDVDPTPFVESEDGSFEEESLAEIVEEGFSLKKLNVAAQDGAADSEVVDLVIDGVLSAKLVRTFCFDGDGGLELVDLNLGDGQFELTIPEDGPIQNESLDLAPLAEITFGEQTRNADDTITVTGIKVTLLPVDEAERANPLGEQDASALNELLGTDFTSDSPLGEAADQLGLSADQLGLNSDQLGLGTDEALQTITIGSATCGEVKDDDGEDHGGDDNRDNGDDDNGDRCDEGVRDDENDDKNDDVKDHSVKQHDDAKDDDAKDHSVKQHDDDAKDHDAKDDDAKDHDVKDHSVKQHDDAKDDDSKDDDGSDWCAVDDNDDVSAAPAPTIVDASLPVTG